MFVLKEKISLGYPITMYLYEFFEFLKIIFLNWIKDTPISEKLIPDALV